MIAPNTLQHLTMQGASAGQLALASQQGQSPPAFIALSQSAISAITVAVSAVPTACGALKSEPAPGIAPFIAAHALAIGAIATDSAIQQTNMTRRRAKCVFLWGDRKQDKT